jgi:hypothetical protein
MCRNVKCTQDVLGYLAKVQVLSEHTDSFKPPRRNYTSGHMNRRPQAISGQDRPRDRRNNINVHYMCRQTDVTQITATDVIIQKTRNFMDARRGQWKAITQADLPLMHKNSIHKLKEQQLTQTGITETRIMGPSL